MDKYYPAKANCTSAELGFIQTLWTVIFSIGKEFYDYYKKVFKLHMVLSVGHTCPTNSKCSIYALITQG